MCGFGMSVRLMLRDKPPPAEIEASIMSTSQFAEPTRLYNKVLRGPLVLTTYKHAAVISQTAYLGVLQASEQ